MNFIKHYTRVVKSFGDEPDMCYDDGVEIYYFNTRGKVGGTNELKRFLTYFIRQ